MSRITIVFQLQLSLFHLSPIGWNEHNRRILPWIGICWAIKKPITFKYSGDIRKVFHIRSWQAKEEEQGSEIGWLWNWRETSRKDEEDEDRICVACHHRYPRRCRLLLVFESLSFSHWFDCHRLTWTRRRPKLSEWSRTNTIHSHVINCMTTELCFPGSSCLRLVIIGREVRFDSQRRRESRGWTSLEENNWKLEHNTYVHILLTHFAITWDGRYDT